MKDKSGFAYGIIGVGMLLIVGFLFFFGEEEDAPRAMPETAGTSTPGAPVASGTPPIFGGEQTRQRLVVAGTEISFALPEHFSVSLFAEGLRAPRVIVQDSEGNILVSIPESGKVVALPDADRDGKTDRAVTVLQGLDRPHGIAILCAKACALFVAEEGALARYAYDAKTFKASGRQKLASLPNGGHDAHSLLLVPASPSMSRSGQVSSTEKLLITSGSSCNVCEESDSRRATIRSINLDGSDLRTFASGLRNAPFMALDPVTGKVWATEMGRDNLGDNIPPDEINIVEEGKNYGWPICYGKGIHDSEFDTRQYFRDPCADAVPSFIDIPAHSAPLGLAFIPEEGWPEGYGNNLLVAYHGSWNSEKPAGYKVVRHTFDAQHTYTGAMDFITGFFPESARAGGRGATVAALGRPAGILALPGGLAYISDDKAGVIYRVAYHP